MNLRAFVKRHKMLEYCMRCIMGLKNEKMIDAVLAEGSAFNYIRMNEYGESNVDKNLYIMEDFYYQNGFFALFINVLSRLAFAERYALIPVVLFNEQCAYFQPEGIDGIKNAFEYYFEQVSPISVFEAHVSKNVFLSHAGHEKVIKQHNTYQITPDDYVEYARIQKKYIRIRACLKDEFDKALQKNLSPNTLGVHVRQTDFNTHLKGHPKSFSPQEYLSRVKDVMALQGFSTVFLATDDSSVIELFRSELGQRLWYYEDAYRETGNVGVHFSQNDRTNHKYLLGKEVLREVVTLSACDGFIGCRSNVSICTQIWKISLDKSFRYIEILDKGTHSSGKIFKRKTE